MQAPREHGRHGGAGDRGEEGGGAEEQQHQREYGGGGAEDHPDERGAQHPAARGVPVPPADPDGQHAERAEGETETVQGREGHGHGGRVARTSSPAGSPPPPRRDWEHG